jgi:hypothetical protein
VMTDCAGERHEFHFRMRLLGVHDGTRRLRAQSR